MLTVGLVVAFATGGGAPVEAQQDENEAKARVLFQEGIKLFNRGQFVEACPKFEESLALFAGVGTRGKLAECYERSGRTASAWRLYLEVEKLARQMDDKRRADVAAKRAKSLEPRLARITIKPGPSAEIDGFTVERDRVAQPSRTFEIPVVVDPGSYRFRASAPNHAAWTRTVTVSEGQSEVLGVPELKPTGELVGGNRDTNTGKGMGTGRILGLSLMSAGALSLVGGVGYFGYTASQYWDDVKNDTPCVNGDPDCTVERDKASSNANYANISGAVGAALIGVGVFVWLRSGKSAKSAESSSAEAWRLVPSVGSDVVGLTLSGRL